MLWSVRAGTAWRLQEEDVTGGNMLKMARVDPSVKWNPALLLEERPEMVCSFCLHVMDRATSGCKRGHMMCAECWPELWRLQENEKDGDTRGRCPGDSGFGPRDMGPGSKKGVNSRRDGGCPEETSPETLHSSPALDLGINRLQVRCQNHAGAGGVSTVKRVKLADAESMSGADLRTALSERGLNRTGNKVALAARLAKDRLSTTEGCTWRGTIAELRKHLEDHCMREPVRCPNGCEEWGFRGEVAQHAVSSCPLHRRKCAHCPELVPPAALAAHEQTCPHANTACPNAGCGVVATRGTVAAHRTDCERELVNP